MDCSGIDFIPCAPCHGIRSQGSLWRGFAAQAVAVPDPRDGAVPEQVFGKAVPEQVFGNAAPPAQELCQGSRWMLCLQQETASSSTCK